MNVVEFLRGLHVVSTEVAQPGMPVLLMESGRIRLFPSWPGAALPVPFFWNQVSSAGDTVEVYPCLFHGEYSSPGTWQLPAVLPYPGENSKNTRQPSPMRWPGQGLLFGFSAALPP